MLQTLPILLTPISSLHLLLPAVVSSCNPALFRLLSCFFWLPFSCFLHFAAFLSFCLLSLSPSHTFPKISFSSRFRPFRHLPLSLSLGFYVSRLVSHQPPLIEHFSSSKANPPPSFLFSHCISSLSRTLRFVCNLVLFLFLPSYLRFLFFATVAHPRVANTLFHPLVTASSYLIASWLM